MEVKIPYSKHKIQRLEMQLKETLELKMPPSLISLRSHIYSFDLKQEFSQRQDTDVQIKLKPNSVTSELPRDSLTIPELNRDANVGTHSTSKVAKFLLVSMSFQCLAS